FFQAEDGIRDRTVTGVQTCALPIFPGRCRCTPKFRIAPNSAAPTDMPIIRMNICEPVATPRSVQSTVPWIDTRNVVLQNPMPMRSEERRVGKEGQPWRTSESQRCCG